MWLRKLPAADIYAAEYVLMLSLMTLTLQETAKKKKKKLQKYNTRLESTEKSATTAS